MDLGEVKRGNYFLANSGSSLPRCAAPSGCQITSAKAGLWAGSRQTWQPCCNNMHPLSEPSCFLLRYRFKQCLPLVFRLSWTNHILTAAHETWERYWSSHLALREAANKHISQRVLLNTIFTFHIIINSTDCSWPQWRRRQTFKLGEDKYPQWFWVHSSIQNNIRPQKSESDECQCVFYRDLFLLVWKWDSLSHFSFPESACWVLPDTCWQSFGLLMHVCTE